MGKNRLEAFSDGVIAIIITIMVLEMKVPHSADLSALLKLWPVFLSYLLSFVNVGIYWNNHHHLLHTVRRVTGPILWANLHLLFWLSLLPFSTGWMGENHFAAIPTALYGLNLLLAGTAYFILSRVIMRSNGCENSLLAKAVGGDVKGRISLVMYAIGTAAALKFPQLSWVLYAAVALMWLTPDRRIENILANEK